MITVLDLKTFALQGLDNKLTVTNEVLASALADAKSIVGNKQINDASFLDIAFYRLVFRLKADISDDLAFSYKEALKTVDKADNQDRKVKTVAKVAQRKNEWA